MLADVGKKIKALRTAKDMTLKQLSEHTGYSTGFLSQLERGLTSVAIDTLNRMCEVFEVELDHFMEPKRPQRKYVLRQHELEVSEVEQGAFVNYFATPNLDGRMLCPRIFELMPHSNLDESIEVYSHGGEEYVYVLEGILTLLIDGEEHALYPGDMAHYSSEKPHNWQNRTTRRIKLLTVHTPNYISSLKVNQES